MRGREQRVPPAGDVATDALDGVVALAEEDAGLRLDLEILDRVALGAREERHVALHRLDVFDCLCRDGGDDAVDIGCRELEGCGRPFVELL